jgi:hypothetical protein
LSQVGVQDLVRFDLYHSLVRVGTKKSLAEEPEILWAVLIQEMSSEHKVKGMLEINTSPGELDIIVFPRLCNKSSSLSLKYWLEVTS